VKFREAGIPRLTIKIAADYCRELLSTGISGSSNVEHFLWHYLPRRASVVLVSR